MTNFFRAEAPSLEVDIGMWVIFWPVQLRFLCNANIYFWDNRTAAVIEAGVIITVCCMSIEKIKI